MSCSMAMRPSLSSSPRIDRLEGAEAGEGLRQLHVGSSCSTIAASSSGSTAAMTSEGEVPSTPVVVSRV